MKKSTIAFLFCLIQLFSCTYVSQKPSLENGDWPQYRGDAGRCGYTPHELSSDLTLEWKYEQKAPSPAWKGFHTRMVFDYAYEPVVAGKTLYFGSSTDCKLYAIDRETGKERWSFFTDAPIRFAPAVWNDRVFVVSDDGYLYCLAVKDGKLMWKKRGGSEDSFVLGNVHMVSRWPARGGVVIKDDIVYFGAGIWPTDGIYVYALDPESGNVLWVNDDSGDMEWDQPHPGARAKSGISAQGYLVAAGERLIIPSGRAVPSALHLSDGALDYFHLMKFRSYGGSRILATDNYLFITSGNKQDDIKDIIGKCHAIFSTNTGELLTGNEINSQAIAITPDNLLYVDDRDDKLKALDRNKLIVEMKSTDNDGNALTITNLTKPVWTIKTNQPESVSLIAAGNKIISGSINSKVTMMDAGSKSVVWVTDIDGIPYGLAAAHGKLYISTDKGTLYCFGPAKAQKARTVKKETINFPFDNNDIYAAAAEEIITKCGITEGYCLDLGCGEGRLAYELAKRTNLTIYGIDSDPDKIIKARECIEAAGLYGTRITFHKGEIDDTGYPNYFANLIVSGRSVVEGYDIINISEMKRLQRPEGGITCIGEPGSLVISSRGPLDGAGEWTHQYHDPANIITSQDELVKSSLGILWFIDSDFVTPSRHGRGVAPLYSKGRLFVQGNHGIRAIDAYNGHTLWEYYIENLTKAYDQDHLNGTAITHGTWCMEDDRLYVRASPSITNRAGRTCLVLDTATGNKIDEFRAPNNGYWGYIAVDNGILFGTIANIEHVTKWGYRESDMNQLLSESDTLFTLDAHTGELLWTYRARHSIRHNSIAIGNGLIYLIDRPIAIFDHLRNPHSQGTHPPGKLVALDTKTGKKMYENTENFYGTLLALSIEHDILIMTYQFTRFRLPSEIGGKMTAFRASDGKRLWEVKTGIDSGQQYPYSSRPIINGDVIYLEPYAFDLKTGNKLDFTLSRSYACGIISSSKNLMLFRSATLGYIDLTEPDKGIRNFGGIRPGCWINALPVGGIVIMPDATYRCNCSYLNKATIALQPL